MEIPESLRNLIDVADGLRFDRYVEWALYEPGHGFFATGGGAGRRGGDFITSAEVGPLFGAVLAGWLDEVWDDLGCPDPFVVLEAGAGRGALALAVRAAAPRCGIALDYTLVERSGALRRAQADHLDLAVGGERWASAALGGTGPRFSSRAELPAGPGTGVVIANELLDNIAFRLAERSGDGWSEVRVVLRADGTLGERLAPLGARDAERCARLAPGASVGARLPLQDRAAGWVAETLGRLVAGRLLVFDYGSSTADLAERPIEQWLRTYRAHGRGVGHLVDPGSQDITVEVALDQLPGEPRRLAQRDWLEELGIESMVAAARREWSERAGVGDLRSLRARSVASEAVALCDPEGLGAFWALEWRVGRPAPSDSADTIAWTTRENER